MKRIVLREDVSSTDLDDIMDALEVGKLLVNEHGVVGVMLNGKWIAYANIEEEGQDADTSTESG